MNQIQKSPSPKSSLDESGVPPPYSVEVPDKSKTPVLYKPDGTPLGRKIGFSKY